MLSGLPRVGAAVRGHAGPPAAAEHHHRLSQQHHPDRAGVDGVGAGHRMPVPPQDAEFGLVDHGAGHGAAGPSSA